MARNGQDGTFSGTTGVPHESGLYTWLLDEVRARFGEAGTDICAACYAHGDLRYPWLLDEVAKAFGEAGYGLLGEFHRRRRAIVARQRLADRVRDLELHRRLLAESLSRGDRSSSAYHQRAIDRASRYIESRIAQGVSEPPRLTIAGVISPDELVEDQRYPTALPLAVRDWYHYSRIHGHSILCAISTLYLQNRAPGHCMRSVAVRAVLRQLRQGTIRIGDEGYVLVDLSPHDGLWYPPEEREMAE